MKKSGKSHQVFGTGPARHIIVTAAPLMQLHGYGLKEEEKNDFEHLFNSHLYFQECAFEKGIRMREKSCTDLKKK